MEPEIDELVEMIHELRMEKQKLEGELQDIKIESDTTISTLQERISTVKKQIKEIEYNNLVNPTRTVYLPMSSTRRGMSSVQKNLRFDLIEAKHDLEKTEILYNSQKNSLEREIDQLLKKGNKKKKSLDELIEYTHDLKQENKNLEKEVEEKQNEANTISAKIQKYVQATKQLSKKNKVMVAEAETLVRSTYRGNRKIDVLNF